jgi:hypothetical protein
MKQFRAPQPLTSAPAHGRRPASMTGSGYHTPLRRRHRRPGRACLPAALAAALLAALGVPGITPPAALAGSAPVLTWTRQAPATHPPARSEAAMAYDPATGNMVLFGGQGGVTVTVQSGTWAWDGSNWARQHPKTSPPARDLPSMAYDAATGNMVLFGGGSDPLVGCRETRNSRSGVVSG